LQVAQFLIQRSESEMGGCWRFLPRRGTFDTERKMGVMVQTMKLGCRFEIVWERPGHDGSDHPANHREPSRNRPAPVKSHWWSNPSTTQAHWRPTGGPLASPTQVHWRPTLTTENPLTQIQHWLQCTKWNQPYHVYKTRSEDRLIEK